MTSSKQAPELGPSHPTLGNPGSGGAWWNEVISSISRSSYETNHRKALRLFTPITGDAANTASCNISGWRAGEYWTG